MSLILSYPRKYNKKVYEFEHFVIIFEHFSLIFKKRNLIKELIFKLVFSLA